MGGTVLSCFFGAKCDAIALKLVPPRWAFLRGFFPEGVLALGTLVFFTPCFFGAFGWGRPRCFFASAREDCCLATTPSYCPTTPPTRFEIRLPERLGTFFCSVIQ